MDSDKAISQNNNPNLCIQEWKENETTNYKFHVFKRRSGTYDSSVSQTSSLPSSHATRLLNLRWRKKEKKTGEIYDLLHESTKGHHRSGVESTRNMGCQYKSIKWNPVCVYGVKKKENRRSCFNIGNRELVSLEYPVAYTWQREEDNKSTLESRVTIREKPINRHRMSNCR